MHFNQTIDTLLILFYCCYFSKMLLGLTSSLCYARHVGCNLIIMPNVKHNLISLHKTIKDTKTCFILKMQFHKTTRNIGLCYFNVIFIFKIQIVQEMMFTCEFVLLFFHCCFSPIIFVLFDFFYAFYSYKLQLC